MTDLQIALIGVVATVVLLGYLWLCDRVRA
jgi:hypothetical protein